MTDEATFTLRTETAGDVTTVYCTGRLVLSTSHVLSTQVKPLLGAGGRVVLDLTAVTFMDSMGLGTIATLWVSSRNRSCQLDVVNLTPRIRDLFTATHLLSLFEPCGQANVRIP